MSELIVCRRKIKIGFSKALKWEDALPINETSRPNVPKELEAAFPGKLHTSLVDPRTTAIGMPQEWDVYINAGGDQTKRIKIRTGYWIVEDDLSRRYVLTDEEFKSNFELIGENNVRS